jgi:hypothetical protein
MPEPLGVSVFISYGRKDASEFADRLARDLKNAGFTVWRDTEDLHSPHPWDEQLAAAIKKSDVVIAVLTPHAVRTGRGANPEGDESVCLDELAFARFSPPPTPIVPLLLIPCDPPFVIFRLNYLDFCKTAADEAQYRIAFEGLVRTIRAVKGGDAVPYRPTHFEPLDLLRDGQFPNGHFPRPSPFIDPLVRKREGIFECRNQALRIRAGRPGGTRVLRIKSEIPWTWVISAPVRSHRRDDSGRGDRCRRSDVEKQSTPCDTVRFALHGIHLSRSMMYRGTSLARVGFDAFDYHCKVRADS